MDENDIQIASPGRVSNPTVQSKVFLLETLLLIFRRDLYHSQSTDKAVVGERRNPY